MTEGLRSRWRTRYEYVRERDRRWILNLPLERLDGYLHPLLAPYIVLNFLDVATTLVAMESPAFRELNPLASSLFGFGFVGFILALLLKYSPTFALIYISFSKDKGNKHPVAIRVSKLSALAVLVAGNILYVYIVGSNLGNLLRLYF